MQKKLALITLRNDYIDRRNERRDSLDIELYNLVLELGLVPVLIPNIPNFTNYFELLLKKENIGLVLFSGGNDILKFERELGTNTYKKRDELEINMIEYCTKNSIPILSICRGLQLIANYLGVHIEKIEGHVNSKHKIHIENSKDNFIVNSFHSYGIKYNNLPMQINPLAINKLDNTVEAFTTINPFKSLNLMWHPERKNGAKIESLNLIRKFLFK